MVVVVDTRSMCSLMYIQVLFTILNLAAIFVCMAKHFCPGHPLLYPSQAINLHDHYTKLHRYYFIHYNIIMSVPMLLYHVKVAGNKELY